MARKKQDQTAATHPGPGAPEGHMQTCSGCRHWAAFAPLPLDKADGCGECRKAPPSVASQDLTHRGPVCRYPVTLAATPRCDSFVSR